MGSDSLAVGLATVAVAVSLYEWAAVRFRWWPTVSRLIEAGGLPARLVTIAAGSLALADHFLLHVLL